MNFPTLILHTCNTEDAMEDRLRNQSLTKS